MKARHAGLEARGDACYEALETQKAFQPDRAFARPGLFLSKT
jgi:hypothetical protein